MKSSIKTLRSAEGPNDVWCIDFMGWFRTRDGERCNPLTVNRHPYRGETGRSHPAETTSQRPCRFLEARHQPRMAVVGGARRRRA